MNSLGMPWLNQPVSRNRCAVRGCHNRALAYSTYCLDCELAGVGVLVVESRPPGPLAFAYRVYCLLCSFEHWLQLTRAAALCARLPACPRCRGGRLLLEEDAGGIGSPWIRPGAAA